MQAARWHNCALSVAFEGGGAHIWVANLIAHGIQLSAALGEEGGRITERGAVLAELLCELLARGCVELLKVANREPYISRIEKETGLAVGSVAFVGVQKEVREALMHSKAPVVVFLEMARPYLP
jgi:hypothetical protein